MYHPRTYNTSQTSFKFGFCFSKYYCCMKTTGEDLHTHYTVTILVGVVVVVVM